MSDTVIQVENLWKQYHLGVINHHTLTRDFQSWWARVRRKEDPNSPVGSTTTQLADECFWALQDISFEVKQGDVLGIIGRNGAGKSTLLKILSQVTAPTKGEVRFKGRIASLLEVGTGFHPELSGRENIFLNGAILGMSKADIRKKLDEIISFSEVDKFIDTPVKRYSSGMYVRLAFAVAAHLEPDILVVDEVLAVGDSKFQQRCTKKMEEVGNEGRTVLFVSHQLGAIQKLCNKCLLLSAGSLVTAGQSSDVIEKYLHLCKKNLRNYSSTIRKGNGKASFCYYYAGDKHGNMKDQFFMGDTIYIYLTISFIEDLTDIELSIEVHDIHGNSIAHMSNEDDNFEISSKNNTNINLCVTIPQIYLAPKSYTLSLWTGKQDETYDYLQEGIELIILQGATINRKQQYPTHMKYYLHSNWTALNGSM